MTAIDKSAQDLINDGQALVHSLAVKIFRNVPVRVELDDLIAYGQVGLAEAAREFDPEQGSQFTTFAYYRVRGAIYDGLSKMSWTSRARYNRLRYNQMANEALRSANETSPLSEGATIEQETKWFRGAVEKLAVVYLATQRDDERRGETALEDPADSPPVVAIGRELSAKLHNLVAALPVPEQRLIRTIYFEGTTLQEAADRLGISKSWASRLHAKTLEQLAKSMRKIGAADSD